MSYLLRVVLPDRPGSLGAVATALGRAGADILSLDVVERGAGGAVDDLVVALPPGGLADTLISSAQSVPGVVVESLRPYSGGSELHRDLELVEELAADPDGALEVLVALPARRVPGLDAAGGRTHRGARRGRGQPRRTVARATAGVVAAGSRGAQRVAGRSRDALVVALARDELGLAPVGDPLHVVLIGRPGGPRFRRSELLRLAHLAGIAVTVARTVQPSAASSAD